MKQVLDFLRDLRAHNDREWFEANKDRYKTIQADFDLFTQQLIDGIVAFDATVKGVTVKDCTYRIYRDVRFSPNKEPYKTHIGAYVCAKGKKSGYAGYYLHLEPDASILAVGLYAPEPRVVTSVRDEILDHGAQFVSAMQQATGFELDQSRKLQRIPKGYPQDSPYAEYLKLKDFTLMKPLVVGEHLLETCLSEFKTTRDFNALLNRAVQFAHEEM